MGTLRHTVEKLHAAPLLQAIEARGGLLAVARNRGVTDREYERFKQAVHRAERSGELTVVAADQLCVQLLGEHPFHVFGDDWFGDELTATTAHAAATGGPARER